MQDSRLRMIELLSKVAFSCAQRLVQQWHAADAQLACLSCKTCRCGRFVRAADAQRYGPDVKDNFK